MKKALLDTQEINNGIDRALYVVTRLTEELAKKGAKPEEIAEELARRASAHRKWAEDVLKYRQLESWYEALTSEEKSTKTGKTAEAAIEFLGEVLARNRVIGY